jgi:hypothetical protein
VSLSFPHAGDHLLHADKSPWFQSRRAAGSSDHRASHHHRNSRRIPGAAPAATNHSFDLPLVGKIKARFTVINLFDRAYPLRDGTGIGVGTPQYAQRRSYYLALSKPF